MTDELRWSRVGARWRLELHVEGETVSELTLLRTNRRFGKAVITSGGLASIRTQEKWRRRGYARRLIDAAHEAMAQRKYAISVLYGIPDMYERFGYATVESVPQLQIELSELLPLRTRGRAVRKSKAADAPGLARLYNKMNLSRSGTAHRSARDFSHVRDQVYVLRDNRGRITGYSVHEDEVDQDGGRFHVWELEAESLAGYVALLAKLTDRASRLEATSVNIWTIENHPVRDVARRFRANYVSYHNRDAGGMARLVHLGTLARQILPELSQRWLAHEIHEPGLTIETDVGQIRLRSTRSGLELTDRGVGCRVAVGQAHLMQMIFGYRRPEDVLEDEPSRPSVRAARLLYALFTNSEPNGSWYEDQF